MEYNNRKGKLTINKFLLCFSLRSGTIFLSWLTVLFSSGLLIVFLLDYYQSISSIPRTSPFGLSHPSVLPFIILILGALLSGTFLSVKTLYLFPAPDEEYSIQSAQANSLLHLAIYNGFMPIVILALSIIYCSTRIYDDDFIISRAVVKTIVIIGFYIHFSLVIRSYYLSILKTDENIASKVPFYKRMLILRKFIFCLSLRTGTFTISLITFMYSFFLAVLLLDSYRDTPRDDLQISFLLMALELSGIFLSQKTMNRFPASNKKYSNKSVQAKSLLHFTVYNGILAVIFLVVCLGNLTRYFCCSLKLEEIIGECIIIIIAIALPIYFTMITYSYYLSILQTGDNINHSISNNLRYVTSDGVPVGVDAFPPTYSECVKLDVLPPPSYSETPENNYLHKVIIDGLPVGVDATLPISKT